MKLFDWLDSRADRRAAHKLFLIEQGLDWRSLATRVDPRFLIAIGVMTLFAYAYMRETNAETANLMTGALIGAFAGAWGYYLGSSNNAARSDARADKAAETALVTAQALPKAPEPAAPDIELPAGETVTVGSEPDGTRRGGG